jgi:hypothetical protein
VKQRWQAGRGRRCGDSRLWLAAALLPLLAAACGGDPPSASGLGVSAASAASEPAPPVGRIEIVPPVTFVATDPAKATSFELEARLWTGPDAERLSVTEADGYALAWSVDQPWLQVESQPGFRATLHIEAGALPAGDGIVTVKAGGASAQARIVPAVAPGQDLLTSGYLAGMSPSLALARGVRASAGNPCDWWSAALVRTGELGPVVANCPGAEGAWGLAVLDTAHAMALLPVEWTPGENAIDAAPRQIQVRQVPLTLRIVVGGSDNLDSLREVVRRVALADVEAANATLLENRAGVVFRVVDTVTVTAADNATIIADCLAGDTLTPAGNRPGMLHVFYVNDMGGARGFTCAGTDGLPQPGIFVGWESHSPSTLVHEMGHILGLTLPGYGHTELLEGFDVSNVMTGGLDDRDPGGRHRLTVGQVFRLNIEEASWLSLATDLNGSAVREAGAPRLACQCGGNDSAGRCPRLITDIASSSGRKNTSNDWDCFDQLVLPGIGSEEHPVGLLAGRSWRARPGTCSVEVSDRRSDHWDETTLLFDNVTRPGACASWAAVFFEKHGLLYAPLIEATDASWSDAADQWTIGRDLPPMDAGGLPRVTVPVIVYYNPDPGMDARVKSDITEAQAVFGEANRSGISLEFQQYSALPSPCPPSASTGITVCYSPSVTGEGSRAGNDIRVSSTHEDFHTFVHLLGQALGLRPLSHDDPVLPLNVMQPVPKDRGDKLTLGQVFRINAFLRPGELPDCASDAARCPALDAGLKP